MKNQVVEMEEEDENRIGGGKMSMANDVAPHVHRRSRDIKIEISSIALDPGNMR